MDNLASLMSEHVKTVSRIPEHVKNAFKGFRFAAACATARSSEGGFSSVGGGDDRVDSCSLWSSDSTQSNTASYYTAIQDTSGYCQDSTFFSAPSTPQLFAPSSASTPIVSTPPRRQSILRRSSRKTGFRERSETQVLKKLVAPPAIARIKPSTTGKINEPKVFTSKIPCRIKLADISELSSMVTIVPKEAVKPSRIPQRIIQEQPNGTPPPPPVATSSQNKSKSTRPPYSPWAVASVRPFKLRRRSSIHRARARQQKDEEDTTT